MLAWDGGSDRVKYRLTVQEAAESHKIFSVRKTKMRMAIYSLIIPALFLILPSAFRTSAIWSRRHEK